MKIDFGTQISGYIIVSFFIVAFKPIYDNLFKASKEVTIEDVKKVEINISLGELIGIMGEI